MQDNGDTYNGWANYETWNVALWLGNDEGLYNIAKMYRDTGYVALADCLQTELELQETPDGVSWTDTELDIEELDEMLADL